MSDSTDSTDPPNQTAGMIGFALVMLFGLVLLAGIGWFFRPWFHGIIYLFYVTPVWWIALGLLIALGFVRLAFGTGSGSGSGSDVDDPRDKRRVDRSVIEDVEALLWSVGLGGVTRNLRGRSLVTTIVLVLVIVMPPVAGTYAAADMGTTALAEANPTESLAETDARHPRIVTEAVADSYASNTLQTPQYKTVRPDITFLNGTPHWSYGLAPDGVNPHFTLKQSGSVYVNMSTQSTDVKTIRDTVKYGVGTAFYNNHRWHLLKNGPYFVDYEDPFMVPDDRPSVVRANNGSPQTYVAVPYLEPEFGVRSFPLPVPYSKPTWGGVALIAPNGSVNHLSPEQARQHPVLEGQKLVPFKLTRKRIAGTKYRNGIINTLPILGSHKGETQLTKLRNGSQPFLQPTRDGVKYYVALEAVGRSQGVREVWEVDGRTGEAEVLRPDESLIGPRKAASYVPQATGLSRLDWNRFTPTEPLPVQIRGQLYWRLAVVSNQGSGITTVAFVNASSNTIHEASTTKAVERFIAGDEVAARTVGGANGSGGSNATSGSSAPPMDGTAGGVPPGAGNASIVVVKRAPDGSVVSTMTVGPNESVSIEAGPAANASGTPNPTAATANMNMTANTTQAP